MTQLLAMSLENQDGRLNALLQCLNFYSVPQLVKLYTAQVVSRVESKALAIHHVAPSVLDAIESSAGFLEKSAWLR